MVKNHNICETWLDQYFGTLTKKLILYFIKDNLNIKNT